MFTQSVARAHRAVLYQNGFADKLGYASALAWVLFVLVMLITALQFSQQKRVTYDA